MVQKSLRVYNTSVVGEQPFQKAQEEVASLSN